VSALAGVRVLDLTRFLAGPFCTAILADLGAEVIKVEAPRGGDEGRYGYPTADGVPVAFLALNRNKKGITLDLRQPEGRALVRRLLPHVDVLAENFAGGTLARWGLAPGALVREHPRLIVASMSGFGQTGPWAERPSYDIVAQAAGGFMSLTGFPESPPTRGGGSLGDYLQGLFGVIGVLAALSARSPPAAGRWSTSRRRTRSSRSSTAGRPFTPRRGSSRRGSGTATSPPPPTTAFAPATAGW